MMTRKSTGMGAVGVITIALIASLAAWTLSANMQRSQQPIGSDSTKVSSLGGQAQAAIDAVPTPLDLHSVGYVETLINHNLIVPNSIAISATGSSLRIIGVRINPSPPSSWSVAIYLWNDTFVNGSTTLQDVAASGGISLVETSMPAGVNGTAIAQEELGAATVNICLTSPSSSAQKQCQALPPAQQSANDGSYIVSHDGFSIIVNPFGNEVSWIDGRNLVSVDVGALNTYSIGQLLSLAETMT